MKVFVTDLRVTSAKVRLFLLIKGKCPINPLSVSVALIGTNQLVTPTPTPPPNPHPHPLSLAGFPLITQKR